MVRILPMGASALLVEVDGIDEVLALHAVLSDTICADDPSIELVPAAHTVLIRAAPGSDLAALAGRVREVASDPRQVGPVAPARPDRDLIEIPVRYDGPDLDEVAGLTGLTPQEVVAAHTGAPWRVAFGGFAPGFAYLVGGDPRLEVARRAEPRTRVPAGSVGLAGEFSGVYQRSSPGGWQLIGSTDVVLWDPARTPPALLQPGLWVRFVEHRPASDGQ